MESVEQATPHDLFHMCERLTYTPAAGIKGIKLVRKGLTHAIAAYDHWTPNSVQMHIWTLGDPITRYFIKEGFRYPFEMCGRGLVIGVTPGDNAKALEFNRRLGFRETYRVTDGWSLGTDVVIQEMRRQECRWLRRNYDGSNVKSAAA